VGSVGIDWEGLFLQFIGGVGFAVEVVGALVIAGAVVASIVPFAAGLWPGRPPLRLSVVRERLGHGLVLALEFLIAADILRSLARPANLLELTGLAVIVVLRTILSLSLEYELRHLGPGTGADRSQEHGRNDGPH